jgi:hypothetical protein
MTGPLPDRRALHQLCDDLLELEAAGALAGIRAVVAQRLLMVRMDVDPIPLLGRVEITFGPGDVRKRAGTAALLAAEIDRAEAGG